MYVIDRSVQKRIRMFIFPGNSALKLTRKRSPCFKSHSLRNKGPVSLFVIKEWSAGVKALLSLFGENPPLPGSGTWEALILLLSSQGEVDEKVLQLCICAASEQ